MYFFLPFLSGIGLFYSFQYLPASTVFIFIIFSLYLSSKKKFFLILIVLSGAVFAFLRYEPVKDTSYIGGREVAGRGIFESYPIETENGIFRQDFHIQTAVDIKTAETLKDLAGQRVTLFSYRGFDTGREWEITLRFQGDRKRLNPGTFGSNELRTNLVEVNSSGDKRISLNSIIQEYRCRLSRYICENFHRDSASFIAAITTGMRTSMDEELRDAFNITGLAHILSISGTHFGLFSVFLFTLFRLSMRALPYRILQRMTIFLTPPQASALLCTPFMLAYLGLSGGSIPAVRSFIMISLFLLGLLIGRRGFWLNSLLFAAFLLALWEPEVILDLSFQLSFLAVLFIGFFVEGMKGKKEEKREEGKEGRILRYLKNALLLTLSATIGTAPLVAYHFHYFSLISPLSNLLVSPLIGFVLIPLSVVSAFLFLITGNYVFTPMVSALSDFSISIVRLLSHIPYAGIKVSAFPIIIVLLFFAGFLVYFLSGKNRYALVIPLVPIVFYLFLSIFEKKELTFTFLDVGQGDSFVVELPDGKTIVIDTGRTGRETASFLRYKGKKTIDAIVLSHIHTDHTGGLAYLLKKFRVKEIWDNGRLIYPEEFIDDAKIKHRVLDRGDVVEGKGYSMYVFHPYPGFYTMYGSDNVVVNNDSVVLKIKGRNKSFLFTGDIEEEAEEDIVHLGRWLKSDVIKIPHQGSRSSAYKPFLEVISPQIAVISVGRDNPFGHPHQEMLEALNGSKIFRTDLDGAIKLRETENGIEIKTHKDYQFIRVRSFKEEIKNLKRLFETW